MADCSHFQWAELSGLNYSWSVAYASRLRKLTDQLCCPSKQFPSIIFFGGTRLKASALRKLFSATDFTKTKAHGLANLLLDPHTVDSDQPVFIADYTVGAPCTNNLEHWSGCHEVVTHRLNAGCKAQKALIPLVQTNLMFPFAQVVCLFAGDWPTCEECSQYIVECVNGRARQQRAGLLPMLLIVLPTDGHIDPFLQVQCRNEFHYVFASLEIIVTHNDSHKPWAGLSPVIRRVARSARDERQSGSMLFRATDLEPLFAQALQAFSCSETYTVEFLDFAAANSRNLRQLSHHVTDVLALAQHVGVSSSLIAKLVGVGLTDDAYRPHVHHFPASDVFDRYYGPECLIGASDTSGPNGNYAARFVEETRKSFIEKAASLGDPRTQDFRLHQEQWSALRTTKTCIFCCLRYVEHKVTCGHYLCEHCFTSVGHDVGLYRFRLVKCPICQARVDNSIISKPPTAGPSLLGIDGGGVRGIATLEFLRLLQADLGGAYPIQDYFDFVAATSAGALIALDLFACRSSLSSTTDRFLNFARQIFPLQEQRHDIFNIVKAWWNDEKYNSGVLEDALRQTFGRRERLFDASPNHAARVKLGIVTTTSYDSQLCVFSNYRGSGTRTSDEGYTQLRPDRPSDEPYLWEVARCSSAAPGFFRPKYLRPFGTLHDGGMRANNPTEIGLWELRKIWPTSSKPAVVVSIGTGSGTSPPICKDLPHNRIFYDGFLARAYRAFMSSPSLDGQSSWLALLNRLDETERDDYYRLNLNFNDTEPLMDDVGQMPALQHQVYVQYAPSIQRVLALWASRFFFELDRQPRYSCGYYTCSGVILCRFRDARALVATISKSYKQAKFVLRQTRSLGLLKALSCCETCGIFQLLVDFEVSRMYERIEIGLSLGDGRSCHISGFPNSMHWFVEQQSFSPNTLRTATLCSCNRRRKRRRSSSSYF